jgi:hypothetical protein
VDPETKQASLSTWAIVDVLGHQRYVGYVTTEAYGSAVLFRIDVPAIEERERVTKRPGYLHGEYVLAGATVKEGAVPGYTKLIGAGSIYAITPCTKEAALAAVEEAQPRPLMSVALPPDRGLKATDGMHADGPCDDQGRELDPDDPGDDEDDEDLDLDDDGEDDADRL